MFNVLSSDLILLSSVCVCVCARRSCPYCNPENTFLAGQLPRLQLSSASAKKTLKIRLIQPEKPYSNDPSTRPDGGPDRGTNYKL